MTPIETLRQYVEGELSPGEFMSRLSSDNDLETLLSQQAPPRFARQHTNTYFYLLGCDYSNPYNINDSKRHIQSVLTEMGVAARRDESEVPTMDAISRYQPKWVDVPVEMMNQFLREAGDRTGKDRESFLKARITDRFKCLKKPPTWLQSPAWQFNENGPMVFAGQIDLDTMYHDRSNLYVFVDQDTKSAKWVIQSV